MGLLTAQQKLECGAAFVQREYTGKPGAVTPWTKPQLGAAIAATDSWIDGNQAAFVAALTAGAPAFAAASSAAEKALLFVYVALKRQGMI